MAVWAADVLRGSVLRWDVFCRVVDNHGDLGVCLRLARQLATRGARVRLWIDDDRALAWMAPHGTPGVTTARWADAECAEPADVVVETFGAEPPAGYLAAMASIAARARPAGDAGAPPRPPPVWVNLEHLSAEDWVERCHALPSPQWHGPAAGCVRHFFYPGFTGRTGGLLREDGLLARRDAFDAAGWLRAHGLADTLGMRRVAVFCYPDAPWPWLLPRLAGEPTVLLLPPLADRDAIAAAAAAWPGLGVRALPWLAQEDVDPLLWACHLNLVRGEDSAVRAMWAGRPFLWQLYRQDDEAHVDKLRAFVTRWQAATGADPRVAAAQRAWNAAGDAGDAVAWPAALPVWDAPLLAAWQAAARGWAAHLAGMPDLASRLAGFVDGLRARATGAGTAPAG